ncbi:MAG: hypothetical protein ACSW8D_06080, partial [Prevotella sp.]
VDRCMAILSQLHSTNAVIDTLRADFSGMEKLENVINDVLHRLNSQTSTQIGLSMAKQGATSLEAFDGWFAPIVKAELGKTLAIVRAKAKQKAATQAQAGSAASGVTWHQAREGNRGYVGITQPRGRISSRKRVVPEPTGGKSGIRRKRSVSGRTTQLNEYFGPDRHFILRFLEFGTDVRTAKPSGSTGPRSMATYGVRGNIAPRSFMHSVGSDMELAANQLGETLVGHVEKWVEKNFKEE